jgi:acyl-coenzyme A thioesterase PaaI-like protein
VTQIELDPNWTITGHLNGGYLMAVIAEAASSALDSAPPLTVSAHFLAPARGGGPAEVEVEVVRRGRLSTARVTLSRGGATLVDGVVTAGSPRLSEPLLDRAAPSDLPPWEECPDAGAAGEALGMELLRHLELRVHPAVASALSGGPAREHAEMSGWVAYRDGRPVDTLLTLAAWDVLPPAPWAAHVWGGLPTVSAQAVFYPVDVAGPLLLEARCDTLRDGIADETARVWDSTGRLVCAARQTAILGA